jgi:hypothetical protein
LSGQSKIVISKSNKMISWITWRKNKVKQFLKLIKCHTPYLLYIVSIFRHFLTVNDQHCIHQTTTSELWNQNLHPQIQVLCQDSQKSLFQNLIRWFLG